MTAAHAMVSPILGSNCVLVALRINGSVFISFFVLTINGHRKLFHAPTNVKIANVRMEDFTSGRITFHKIFKLEHPSIFAASITSSGTPKIACLIIKVPRAVGSGNINAW